MLALRTLTLLSVVVILVATAVGQETSPPQHMVQDWSTHHVVFTGVNRESAVVFAKSDPRAWVNWVAHAGRGVSPTAFPKQLPLPLPAKPHRRPFKRLRADWNVPLFGGTDPRFSPAKFGFDINATPDCTNDYVVFPTTNSAFPGQSGGGTPASLIAFNNLYTGPSPTGPGSSGICPTPFAPSTDPSVLFAYNTATNIQGSAHLSPVLSLDGKKIAFVESNDGFSDDYTAFHVLTWKAGEGTSVDSAAVPGDCSAGNSCMATLVLSSTHGDHFSSPFIDYQNDVAYVGDDGGILHKITPVFGGTPTEVVGNGWPLPITAFGALFGVPVFDSVSGHIFMSDNSSGSLWIIDAAIPRTLIEVGGYISISDPIVDSTNQTVFVVGSRSPVLFSADLIVDQFDTSGNRLQRVDAGPLGQIPDVYAGTFDNAYFVDPATGGFYFAGSLSAGAGLFRVGFTMTFNGITLDPFSISGPLILSRGSGNSLPTSMAEVFNPNFLTAQDRLFIGIDANCTLGSFDGCVESVDITKGLPATLLDSYLVRGNSIFGIGGIIIDNVSTSAQAANIYFEAVPVTSGALSGIKLTQSGLQ